MKKKRNFLVYLGNAGLGKTYFSAAMIEPALTDFQTFRYWKEATLLKRIRSSMDDIKGDYLDTLKFMLDDHLIFLDDMGSTGLNDWRKEVFFEAIDLRYNSTLPTIITSNFTRQEIEENYHPRVASRLFDKDNIIIEIHDGPDYRKEIPCAG
jgi:DNA replication protein DnaC